jgi:hypothetical protein
LTSRINKYNMFRQIIIPPEVVTPENTVARALLV